jgi:hypothetical protein
MVGRVQLEARGEKKEMGFFGSLFELLARATSDDRLRTLPLLFFFSQLVFTENTILQFVQACGR